MTHFSKLLVAELDALAERVGRRELRILETGSIRNEAEQYHQNDGWSTLTFAEYVAENGGSLTSIDLDTRAADAVLTRHGLRDCVELVQDHSINVLAGLIADHSNQHAFDLMLLDSDNDADLILHEYLLAKQLIRSPGVILVDDVEPGSKTVVKGHKLLPLVEAGGMKHRMLRRTGDAGFSVGVLALDA